MALYDELFNWLKKLTFSGADRSRNGMAYFLLGLKNAPDVGNRIYEAPGEGCVWAAQNSDKSYAVD